MNEGHLIGHLTERERDGASTHSFEWTVPLFLSLGRQHGDWYLSPPIHAFDSEWRLILYPHGIQPYSLPDYASVSLCRWDVEQPPPITLDVTLGFQGAEYKRILRRTRVVISEDNNVFFWNAFEERSELGAGDVVFQLHMAKDVTAGEREVLASLRGLLAGGEDTDVTLEVGGREFRAHRAILRSRSAIFRAMFAHDMIEKRSGSVRMPDGDPESFPHFLEHLYTGAVGMISAVNVFGLYAAADRYDLRALRRACVEFARTNLTVSNFCETVALASRHGERELMECAAQFFGRNAAEICRSEEWRIFLGENMAAGNELIIQAFSK